MGVLQISSDGGDALPRPLKHVDGCWDLSVVGPKGMWSSTGQVVGCWMTSFELG